MTRGVEMFTVAVVSRPCLVAALLLGMALPIGCGPVEYIAQVGGRASSSLAQARREKADQLAPYEYTAAGEYLKKSKEEAGRSQFQAALEYGKIAEEMADRSRALARERKAGRGWEIPGTDPAVHAPKKNATPVKPGADAVPPTPAPGPPGQGEREPRS